MNLFVVSLGCDKNLVDTEKLLYALCHTQSPDIPEGFVITDDEASADVIVINTCCFIGDAKEESINTIIEMGQLKAGRLKVLAVCGCLAQRYEKEILESLPEVDVILGVASWQKMADAILLALKGQKSSAITEGRDNVPKPLKDFDDRMLTTFGHTAYLKIAEGCDKYCTYCIIPYIRGRYQSVPKEELIKEAASLAQRGVKELVLVAQETTLYGMDLYGQKALPGLLKDLAAIPGLVWIRLLYCYPEEITPELVTVIQTEPKVLPYLDIPIQHCSDAVLKRMNRKTTKKDLVRQISLLRSAIPDIALRTTLISGFPGETREAYQELKAFVKEMHFDRLGVFPYSPEEGTPAAAFPDRIPLSERKRRAGVLMRIQQKNAFKQSRAQTGRIMDVFIEGCLPDEDIYIGRTYMDAPKVDGQVFLTSDRRLFSGDFVKALITGASGYDLTAKALPQS